MNLHKLFINNILLKSRSKILFCISFILIFANYSCKKFVEVPIPETLTNSEQMFTSDAKAISVLTAIYSRMSPYTINDIENIPSISFFIGLSSDEFTLYDPLNDQDPIRKGLYTNSLNSTLGIKYFQNFYAIIYKANVALNAIIKSSSLNSKVKQQLMGECRFIRAFSYFYLTNIYGDVPLVLGTDYKINGLLPRVSKSEIYSQVILDLKEANTLLNENFLDGTLLSTTKERVRPTKWAATALLARVFLYNKDYVNAEAEASKIIDKNDFFSLVSLNDVFLKNSNEAIWQIQSVNDGFITPDARAFILPTSGPVSHSFPLYLSQHMLDSFEPGDKRKSEWVGTRTVNGIDYNYPHKYKVNTINSSSIEYSTVLRLGEQYLIRAEAREEQNKISEAVKDINILRSRSRSNLTSDILHPLPDLQTGLSQNKVLDAILHERQVELFSEWGHRWFDLKRSGKINSVMPSVTLGKGGIWSSNWQLYPIPIRELMVNPNLYQNIGYN